MSAVFKVRTKALAQEARMLRDQIIWHGITISDKLFSQQPTDEVVFSLGSLQSYKENIKKEARATFLARTFLKNKPRSTVEQSTPPLYIAKAAQEAIEFVTNKDISQERWYEWLYEGETNV